MPAAAVFSIILAAITVLVLAAYLISIARILVRQTPRSQHRPPCSYPEDKTDRIDRGGN